MINSGVRFALFAALIFTFLFAATVYRSTSQETKVSEFHNISITFLSMERTVGTAYEESLKFENIMHVEPYGSPESSFLTSKYGIDRLPAVLIEGETEGLKLEGFEELNGALVYQTNSKPYVDLISGKTMWGLNVTLISAENCKECVNLSDKAEMYENRGAVKIEEYKEIDYQSPEAVGLIKKYEITAIPTILVEGDLEKYPMVMGETKGWNLYPTYPPYINLSTGELKGVVNVTYITDASCKCFYNITSAASQLMDHYNIYVGSEKFVDMNSDQGRDLMDLYDVKFVPTFIVTGDTEVYYNSIIIFEEWRQIYGTVTEGAYIFDSSRFAGICRTK
jgi:hypothetical protein